MPDTRLVLFFTRGVSLRTWETHGMFEREVALYRRLQSRGVHLTFVTYGGPTDLEYESSLPGIRILCNRWGLPRRLYDVVVPFVHGVWLRHATVLKSNQINGSEVALRAGRLWRKPLIARCGYVWSALAASGGPRRDTERSRAEAVERVVFAGASRVVVTTAEMKYYIEEKYGTKGDKVRVVPNYVLTERFAPDWSAQVSGRLCYVGRLSAEKNLLSLVDACGGLDVELVLVGDGPLRQAIACRARDVQANVQMPGVVPHLHLPRVLNSCSAFLLVSYHEGHPKALLEAMSCGLPVIGANSPGIRELITHGENGWLCTTEPANMRAAILEVMSRRDLGVQLGRNARRFVKESFGIEHIAEMELGLLQEVVAA